MREIITTQQELDRAISRLKTYIINKNKYILTFGEIKEKRTLDQNKLYWVWLNCIEMETGNDKDELHEYFKDKLLPKMRLEMFDDTYERRSTKNLDTAMFSEYLERIKEFARDKLNIRLLSPEEKEFEAFYNCYAQI
jgi:hypothetical protein